jgi:hypothetical protein
VADIAFLFNATATTEIYTTRAVQAWEAEVAANLASKADQAS